MFSSVAVKAGLTNIRDPRLSKAVIRRLNRQAKRRFEHAHPDEALMSQRSYYRRIRAEEGTL